MKNTLAQAIIKGGANPTKHTSFVSMGGIDYLIGTLLILLGITIFILFNKKAKVNMLKYKEQQLAEYNKNKKTRITDYSRTRLYLPF